MPVDVVKVATASGEVTLNGSATVGVNKFGGHSTLPPKINGGLNPEGLETLYEDRFDDPRFYTGDTDD